MSEHDPIRDFHDELLSAYLDGELSTEERARVEERLAVDPVARQMLEELRSVSQAVQGLPQEALGDDLRPVILLRTQQVLGASPAAQAAAVPSTTPAASPASPGLSLSKSAGGHPRVTIGRTRRGWVWAAMAVAAALVIMFVDRGAVQDEKLPQVAAGNVKREVPELWSGEHNGQVARNDANGLGIAGGSQPTSEFRLRQNAEQFFDDKSTPSTSTSAGISAGVGSGGDAKQISEGIASASGRLLMDSDSDINADGAQLGRGLGDESLFKRMNEPGAGIAGPGPGAIDALKSDFSNAQPDVLAGLGLATR
jgi:hypothetical protein